MKKLVLGICLSILLVGCTKPSSLPRISIAQIIEHSSLNTIRDSMIEELNSLGYVDQETCIFDVKSAQGEPSNLTSIMQTFKANQSDVIVAIATPTALSAAPFSKEIPVIFSAVSDPIQANLVLDLNKPNQNITGTSDAIQVSQILDLATLLYPDAKVIGYIYNASEANSVSNLEKTKQYAKKYNLTVEVMSITSTNELSQAATVLSSKVDFIFAPNDNTIASAMPSLTSATNAANIPLFVGADSMVMDGGLATIGINYVELGKETAHMIDAVLKGTSIEDIPVKVFDQDLNIYINLKQAELLGLTIPESILSNPNFVAVE